MNMFLKEAARGKYQAKRMRAEAAAHSGPGVMIPDALPLDEQARIYGEKLAPRALVRAQTRGMVDAKVPNYERVGGVKDNYNFRMQGDPYTKSNIVRHSGSVVGSPNAPRAAALGGHASQNTVKADEVLAQKLLGSGKAYQQAGPTPRNAQTPGFERRLAATQERMQTRKINQAMVDKAGEIGRGIDNARLVGHAAGAGLIGATYLATKKMLTPKQKLEQSIGAKVLSHLGRHAGKYALGGAAAAGLGALAYNSKAASDEAYLMDHAAQVGEEFIQKLASQAYENALVNELQLFREAAIDDVNAQQAYYGNGYGY